MSQHDDHDDLRVFREAMADARPLKNDRADAAVVRPRPAARFARREVHAVLNESLHGDLDPTLMESGEELLFVRAHVPRRVVRKLRRGGYRVMDELDLHGLNALQARSALADFLRECAFNRFGCVRIVTGKGRRSGYGGPVLKPRVARWLARRDEVQAYSTARPVDGGSGALYVLLRHT
jgi:DNA-nicking Smr family endonuclease